jgi:hypothetical protein
MRSSVDLPQPDGPTSTTNSPSAISRFTPWITRAGRLRAQILQIPGVGKGSPDRCRLAEGRRAVPRRHQGQRRRRRVRRRRTDLHGPEQPEPAQLPVPRLPEAVGGLYRRQDQLDRPRPGRLQRPPAAVDRHRHRRFRHHRDGRAVRGRHRRQGPARRDAGLGQDPDRHGRPTSATCKPPVGTWDGKTYRITIDGDCHTFAYRKDYFGDAGSITGGPKCRRPGKRSTPSRR